ncbi:MAG: phosphoribosylformylglycinamidine cyclo-ligase [Candidatus Micrarchaeota archaeon]|nr:phosphoribosylformylglycinamidine cyclo-ligase [Candidatus Micrarchaeota archaeon]
MAKITYSKSGVDIDRIKKIQQKINKLILSTKNKYTPKFIAGHYGGFFNVSNQKLVAHCDGVGTKILVAQKLNKHDSIGIDAVAMNVNDIVCVGAKPIVGLDYIAIAKDDKALLEQIIKGIIKGCKMSNVALIGGETAIIPDMLQNPEDKIGYDLSFTVIGKLEKFLDGSKIKEGQVLIGLQSSGLHSNGFSLARKILDINKWSKKMLEPTRIYSPIALEILQSCKVSAFAHITGGAFSKLSRLIKFSGYGFYLEQMPQPKEIFAEIFNIVQDPFECYRTFNMGIGFVIVAPATETEKIFEIAKKHRIKSYEIGKTIAKKDVILNFDGKKISLLRG